MAWKPEIRGLWKAVVRPAPKKSHRKHVQGKEGFGYGVRKRRAGPGNTKTRDLLADGRYSEAVLDFLRATKVGAVKQGVLIWEGVY